MPRELIEKEWAIIQRGGWDCRKDFEVMKVRAYSEHHAEFLAKQRGAVDIARIYNTAGPLYQRFLAEQVNG